MCIEVIIQVKPTTFFIGVEVATVLGAPLGIWIGEHFGWRLSFTLVAGLAGVAFLFLVIFRLPTSATLAPLSLKERLRPMTHPRVVVTLFPALLWNVGGRDPAPPTPHGSVW